jgi:hypothetical protein
VSSAVFRREGDVWAIEFGADAFRLRDAKGLRYLALLLESSGQERHSLDLVQSVDGENAAAARPSTAAGRDTLASDAFGDAGPALDAAAKQAYRARLEELREEVDEATRWNDTERAHRSQVEIDVLTHELAAAMGLGGRPRTSGSSAERARISVGRAIRGAMDRISAESPELGAHLAATIRTGTFCSYVPDPRAPIRWAVSEARSTPQTASFD